MVHQDFKHQMNFIRNLKTLANTRFGTRHRQPLLTYGRNDFTFD